MIIICKHRVSFTAIRRKLRSIFLFFLFYCHLTGSRVCIQPYFLFFYNRYVKSLMRRKICTVQPNLEGTPQRALNEKASALSKLRRRKKPHWQTLHYAKPYNCSPVVSNTSSSAGGVSAKVKTNLKAVNCTQAKQ